MCGLTTTINRIFYCENVAAAMHNAVVMGRVGGSEMDLI